MIVSTQRAGPVPGHREKWVPAYSIGAGKLGSDTPSSQSLSSTLDPAKPVKPLPLLKTKGKIRDSVADADSELIHGHFRPPKCQE